MGQDGQEQVIADFANNRAEKIALIKLKLNCNIWPFILTCERFSCYILTFRKLPNIKFGKFLQIIDKRLFFAHLAANISLEKLYYPLLLLLHCEHLIQRYS